MIYISHRLEEILGVSDRITVMRDGRKIETLDVTDADEDKLVRLMVGRVISGKRKEKSAVRPGSPLVLEVKNLDRPPMVHSVSFNLRRGEILGFAGLMGAGRTEVARALYGADKADGGEITVGGKAVRVRTPHDAVKNGICYLSEDRKRYGLLLGASVADNTALASVGDYINGVWIDDARLRRDAKKYNEALRTKTPSIMQPVRALSGGNQQKVIIARWLLRDCDILIFDEPTRGIDVGAKSEIYELIEKMASEGKSVILISSEMSELLRLSDRIIVMCEGRVTAELPISEASQENIMRYAVSRRET